MVGFEDLNVQQLDVVQAPINADLVVIAGAGTGKTRVIVSRIKRLLAEPNVISSHILAISFSRDTKQELDERLNKTLFQGADLPDSHKVQVSTFNSLGLKIINRHRDKAALYPDVKTKTEAELTWELLNFFKKSYNVFLFKQARDDDKSVEVSLDAAAANNYKDRQLVSTLRQSWGQICNQPVTDLGQGVALPPINWQLYAQDFGLLFPKSIAPDLKAQSQHFSNLSKIMGWQQQCHLVANAHAYLFRQVWQAMDSNPRFALAHHWKNALWFNQGSLDLVSNCWEEITNWHNDHDNLGSDKHQFAFMSNRFAFSMQELYAYISKRKEAGALPRISIDKFEYYSDPANFKKAWYRAVPCDLPRLRELAPANMQASLYCPFKKDIDKNLKEVEREQVMQDLAGLAKVETEEETKLKQEQLSMLFDNTSERAEMLNLRGPECSCTYCPYFLDWYEILFAIYEQWREDMHYLDFPEQINRCVRLLTGFPDIRQQEQKKIHFLFVDEFQDTNRVQFDLLCLLKTDATAPAHEQNHLCVVGDDDQSIYGWRGADFRCLREIHDYLGHTQDGLKSLTINYRSHQNILNLANSLIAHNQFRILAKRLLCPAAFKFEQVKQEQVGYDIVSPRVNIVGIESFRFEGLAVAQAIEYVHNAFEVPYGEIAVLFRLNHLSANVEFSLLQHNIPYFIKEQAFATRTPVQHALAAIRLALDPHDDIAFILLVSCLMHKQGEQLINALQEIQFSRLGTQEPEQARRIESEALTQAYQSSYVALEAELTHSPSQSQQRHAWPRHNSKTTAHSALSAKSPASGARGSFAKLNPDSTGVMGSLTTNQGHGGASSHGDLGTLGSLGAVGAVGNAGDFEQGLVSQAQGSRVDTVGSERVGVGTTAKQPAKASLEAVNAVFNSSLQRSSVRLDTLLERALSDIKHDHMPSLYQVANELDPDNVGAQLKTKDIELLNAFASLLEKIDEVQNWPADTELSLHIDYIFNTLGITERYMRRRGESEDSEQGDKSDWENIQQLLTIADMCSLSLAVKRASQIRSLFAPQDQSKSQTQEEIVTDSASSEQDGQRGAQEHEGEDNALSASSATSASNAHLQEATHGLTTDLAPSSEDTALSAESLHPEQSTDADADAEHKLTSPQHPRSTCRVWGQKSMGGNVLEIVDSDLDGDYDGDELMPDDYDIYIELIAESDDNEQDEVDSALSDSESDAHAQAAPSSAASAVSSSSAVSDVSAATAANLGSETEESVPHAIDNSSEAVDDKLDRALTAATDENSQAQAETEADGKEYASSLGANLEHALNTVNSAITHTVDSVVSLFTGKNSDSSSDKDELHGEQDRASLSRTEDSGECEKAPYLGGQGQSTATAEADANADTTASYTAMGTDNLAKDRGEATEGTVDGGDNAQRMGDTEYAAQDSSSKAQSKSKSRPVGNVSFSLNLDELEEELKQEQEGEHKPLSREQQSTLAKSLKGQESSQDSGDKGDMGDEVEGSKDATTSGEGEQSALSAVATVLTPEESKPDMGKEMSQTVEAHLRWQREYLEQAKLIDPWIEEDQANYTLDAVELRHLVRNMIYQLDQKCTAPWAEELRILQAVQTEQLSNKDKVQLLSVHGSKGKEFQAVILLGCERNYMPYFGAEDDEERLEEERRLAYVAFTRAKRYLLVTFCKSRMSRGDTGEHDTGRSQFVNEAIFEWSQMPKEQRPYRETLIKADDFVNYANVWDGRIDK